MIKNLFNDNDPNLDLKFNLFFKNGEVYMGVDVPAEPFSVPNMVTFCAPNGGKAYIIAPIADVLKIEVYENK